jgi:hypothetical protein
MGGRARGGGGGGRRAEALRPTQLLGDHVHVEHQHQPMDRKRENILRELAQPLHELLRRSARWAGGGRVRIYLIFIIFLYYCMGTPGPKERLGQTLWLQPAYRLRTSCRSSMSTPRAISPPRNSGQSGAETLTHHRPGLGSICGLDGTQGCLDFGKGKKTVDKGVARTSYRRRVRGSQSSGSTVNGHSVPLRTRPSLERSATSAVGFVGPRQKNQDVTAPSSPSALVACIWCDGQGFIPATGIMCRTCHGRGVIVAR